MRAAARFAVLVTLLLAPFGAASAQDYPNKPIRLIISAAPGGITDILARIIADKVGNSIGQRVIPENKPGAGGNIAAEYVAKTPPDGYTIMIVNIGLIAFHQWMYKNLGFDPLNDFDPVGPVADAPSIVAIWDKLPVRTLREFIDYAKQNPGKVNYGSAGVGTMPHLVADLFSRMTGIEMVHVPYRGANPAAVDLAVGQIQTTFIALGSMRAQLSAGQVRMLAIASKERLAAIPDVLTFDEVGLPGYEAVNWFSLFAPAKTPLAIRETFNRHVQKMFDDPEVVKRLQEGGMVPMKETVAQFTARVKADHARWGDVIKKAGIKPE
jgi:tripartite-type tricarboxylate transporter receptor subunit TctC